MNAPNPSERSAVLGDPGRLRGLARAAAMLHAAWAWVLFAGVVTAATAAILAARDLAPRRRIARNAARLLCRLAGVQLSAAGLERLPSGPHVLVVNHLSFVDGIVLTALLPCNPGYSFTVRRELPQQSLFCPLLRALDAFILHTNGHPAHTSVERAVWRLRAGSRIVVFPEGQIRSQPGLLPFHSGAFAAAAQAGVPVVPAALRGTRQVLPLKSWLPRRTAVTLEIGNALSAGSASMRDILALCDDARRQVLLMSREPDLAVMPVSSQANPP
ncbi:lysophospholipid acyltransferase family protein [Noviherbaspirillum galbum]|uniref:1-acyl-sn-glycerol-3-phosphate acyltransferase n=1 Tax=Noviherbaspirillum galbum TaxID=2709383 RepID=A0A6B3SN70_9BURK|nr:lysophospholipid acyltransferase family protein [Noviherbaspirillum galbum]NEX62350.1 1-acyl-sn-glycerol-3-phosphate acyltransferase [Noviherbaspirillum galbum]